MTFTVGLRKDKIICEGSGATPTETRAYAGSGLGKCGKCGRVLKPKPGDGTLRSHSIRGSNTASHDATMETLWGSS